jgi:hypothetical protein
MRRKKIQHGNVRNRALSLALALIAVAVQVLAQQDEGPILHPKKHPAKPGPNATLLVMCDIACNWKLDGEAKGRIEAGGSAKAKVELGQHVVVGATEDDVDQVKQLSEIKTNGQTVISIELKPMRDARLKAEHDARDKAAQEQKERLELEAQQKAARERQEHEEAAATNAKFENLSDLTWSFTEDWTVPLFHKGKPQHLDGQFVFAKDGSCTSTAITKGLPCRWIKQGQTVTIVVKAVKAHCDETWRLTQNRDTMSGQREFHGETRTILYDNNWCNSQPAHTVAFKAR